MKRVLSYIYPSLSQLMVVALIALLDISSIYAQGFPYVVITSTGIINNTGGVMPDDLFNNSHLPNDFYQSVFDEAGNPIMDHLVILTPYSGLTGSWAYANGYTGLVQFTKQGNYYASVNAGIDAQTVAEAATVSLLNMKGKKIYITGSCQNAFAGDEKQEGFICLSGAKGETVDVYLHNVNIQTRSKIMPGQSVNQWLKGYISGNASPISIASTSDDTEHPFTVNFHTRGTNTLTGGATSKLNPTENAINNILADILYLSAAPIAIRPDITVVSLYDTISVQKDTVIQSSTLSRDKTIIVNLPATITTNNERQFDVTQNNEIRLLDNMIIADGNQITDWRDVTISWEGTKIVESEKEVVMTGLERYRNIATKLVFDDKWSRAPGDTIRTNGILNLPVVGDLGAPSIDLGNAKGKVEFNGGQYKFHTPRTNSMFYVSTLAICYRQMKLAGFTTIGVGSSASVGSATEEVGTRDIEDVVIKDGTFSTYPAEKIVTTTDPDDTTPVDVVLKGWYRTYTDLRLPYNTRILGGTFNYCEVYRCDGSGEQGVSPVYRDPNTGKETPLVRGDFEGIAPEQLKPNGVMDFSDGKPDDWPEWYGYESLTPEEDEDGEMFLHPYIPGAGEVQVPTYSRNWVTLIPEMGVKDFLTMGGNQFVNDSTVDKKKKLDNKYLFYARLNDYTKKYASIQLAGFDIEVYQAIDMVVDASSPEAEFSQVTNTKPYRIDNALYSMLSFPSNEWQLISLPYDVHNIYVMETTNEQLGKNDSIGPNETLDDFLKRQGKADGNLAQNIVTSLCPDIFSGKGSGINMNLIDIATIQIKCPPYKLTHYDGSNAASANYYLYEQVNEKDDDGFGGDDKVGSGIGLWRLAGSVDEYSDKWQPAPTYADRKDANGDAYKDLKGQPAPPVLMQRGRIYSLYLPSGKDHYWDGKYLIFEGYGPQSVQGTDIHKNFLSYSSLSLPSESNRPQYSNSMLGLQGNITFANYKTTETTFLPAKDEPTANKGYWYHFDKTEPGVMIRPGQVYAGMSKTDTDASTALKPLGVIRKIDVTDGDDRPIVGNVLLYAYAANGMIQLMSHAEQYVQVIGVDGRVVFAGILHDGEQRIISATTGVYVVRSEAQAIKLLVE